MVISLVFLLAGIGFLWSGIKGTKPHSPVLYGEDESGKPIDWPERVAWSLVGLLGLYAGVVRLIHLARLPR
jgi:hypothetical protein